MSQSPQQQTGSKSYSDGWRAINILIRSGGSWSGRERNVCYRNRGDGGFDDVAFVSGLDLPQDGRSFVPLDFDGDGDLDLIQRFRNGSQLRVFRNDSPQEGNRSLRLRLRTSGGDQGVGARILLRTDRRSLRRDVASGSGFLSQRPRAAHFGLAEGERVQAIDVHWPNGTTEQISDPPPEGEYLLVQGAGAVRKVQSPAPPRPLRSPHEPAANEFSPWLAEALPAPELSLDGLEGPHSLKSLRGGKVLLNFWATWCPPCRDELADLSAHSDQMVKAGLTVLAVSVDDPEDRAKVAEFARERQLSFPILFADEETVGAYTVLNRHLFDLRADLAIPTSFLIDEQGEILKVYRGAASAAAIVADAKAGSGPVLPFAGRWIASSPQRDWVAPATALAERGLLRPARRLFEAALERGQASPELHHNLAGLLIEAGDLDRAELLLRESLVAQPGSSDARVNLAAVMLRQGHADQALALVDQALRLQADDPAAMDLAGSALFALGRNQEAEQRFRQAVALAPEQAAIHANLGALLAGEGRGADAIASLERARELGDNSARLLGNLGVLYMQSGMPANARLVFSAAARSHPEDYGAQLNLGMYYLQARDYQQARRAAREAGRADPQRPEWELLLAQVEAAEDDVEEARRLLQHILERSPDFEPARAMLDQL